MNLAEVIDKDGTGVCSVLSYISQCIIVSLASSGSAQGSFFFLLDVTLTNSSTYYIVTSYRGKFLSLATTQPGVQLEP